MIRTDHRRRHRRARRLGKPGLGSRQRPRPLVLFGISQMGSAVNAPPNPRGIVVTKHTDFPWTNLQRASGIIMRDGGICDPRRRRSARWIERSDLASELPDLILDQVEPLRDFSLSGFALDRQLFERVVKYQVETRFALI
jgi:hypothetical protein